MKLIIAIVQDDEAGRLISAMMKEGFSVTKLATTGGFLRAGNTTLLLGVENEKLDSALSIIEKTCKSRRQIINSGITAVDPVGLGLGATMGQNIEITVGGATVFVLDVLQFAKF